VGPAILNKVTAPRPNRPPTWASLQKKNILGKASAKKISGQRVLSVPKSPFIPVGGGKKNEHPLLREGWEEVFPTGSLPFSGREKTPSIS